MAGNPGVRRKGKIPLSYSCDMWGCRVNIKICLRECCKSRWSNVSNQQGRLEEMGTVNPDEQEEIMVNVAHEGFCVLLVHIQTSANKGQTSPHFPM